LGLYCGLVVGLAFYLDLFILVGCLDVWVVIGYVVCFYWLLEGVFGVGGVGVVLYVWVRFSCIW